jgi:hypothetical protein
MLSCCGGDARGRITGANMSEETPGVDYVQLEYVGPDGMDDYAVNGRSYRAGSGAQYKFVAVHPDDVPALLNTRYFEVRSPWYKTPPKKEIKAAKLDEGIVVEE